MFQSFQLLLPACFSGRNYADIKRNNGYFSLERGKLNYSYEVKGAEQREGLNELSFPKHMCYIGLKNLSQTLFYLHNEQL